MVFHAMAGRVFDSPLRSRPARPCPLINKTGTDPTSGQSDLYRPLMMWGQEMASIHIGISGWRYTPWRADFYPKGLKQKDELSFASRAVSSIEINGSFYALQRPDSYARWYEQTPEHFVFSVKAPRYVTHILRLRETEAAIANFFASGLFALREKLGPILWQFPPSFKFNPERF